MTRRCVSEIRPYIEIHKRASSCFFGLFFFFLPLYSISCAILYLTSPLFDDQSRGFHTLQLQVNDLEHTAFHAVARTSAGEILYVGMVAPMGTASVTWQILSSCLWSLFASAFFVEKSSQLFRPFIQTGDTDGKFTFSGQLIHSSRGFCSTGYGAETS